MTQTYTRIFRVTLLLCAIVLAGCSSEPRTATAIIQIEKPDLGPNNLVDGDVADTNLSLLQSDAILNEVSNLMISSDIAASFLDSYDITEINQDSIVQILSQYRKIEQNSDGSQIYVNYSHPKPMIAAYISNLFAQAFIDFDSKLRVDGTLKAVEDLRVRIDEQKKLIQEMEMKIAETGVREGKDSKAYQKLLADLKVQKSSFKKLVNRMAQEQAATSTLTVGPRIIQSATIQK
ncbi:MAG: hypothetical protein ACSHYA_04170 [Opitutaceae bacterium]